MEKIINSYKSQQFNGESPILHPESGRIYFVDTGKPECIEYDPVNGKTKKFTLSDKCQCIAPVKTGGWIGTTDTDIIFFDQNFNTIKQISGPEYGKEHMNLSDGTIGPDGCFYFGSMNHDDLYSKDGCIFKIDSNFNIKKVLTDFALPNGIAFTNDGTKFYVTEMFAGCIWVFDYDKESGSFSNKSKFAEIPEEDGLPDGLIIDADGFIYSAHWAGFRITRYAPDGTIERVIKFPVPTPTCMAFGGRDNKNLYVTTARKALTEEELEKYPESGDFFAVETSFNGRNELQFGS